MKNHGAHFVPFPEEPNDLILANLIVVLRGGRPKLYFLELRPAAALALLMRLLVLLVKKFAVVGDLADRRIRRRRDFHQVQSPFARHTNSLVRLHHTKLGTLLINHPDFAGPNPLTGPQCETTEGRVTKYSMCLRYVDKGFDVENAALGEQWNEHQSKKNCALQQNGKDQRVAADFPLTTALLRIAFH